MALARVRTIYTHEAKSRPTGGVPMNPRIDANELKLPGHEDFIAPVTIFDPQGRLVRVAPAAEFRAAQALQASERARRASQERAANARGQRADRPGRA